MIRQFFGLVQNSYYSSFQPTVQADDRILYIRARNDQNEIENIECRFDLVDLAIQWQMKISGEIYGFKVFRQYSKFKVSGLPQDELISLYKWIEGKIPFSRKLQDKYELVNEQPTVFEKNSIIVKDKITKEKYIMKRIYNEVQVPVDEFKIVVYLQKNTHPNILIWNSHYTDQKIQYISLDYYQYVTLDKIFNKYRKFPLEFVRKVARQLLNVLNHLHSKGIIYKDIKPENIIITNFDNLQVKIGDFGQAVLGEEFCRFGGTSLYRAPEVIEGFIHTNKFDIYSLGVLLYELLTNTRIYRRLHQSDCAQLQQLEIDPSAVDLVTQMLHHDPYQRLDVIECLDHYFFIDEQPYVANERDRLLLQSINPRFKHN